MKINAYAVFDRKAAAFDTPLFFPNDNVVIRSFARSVNTQNENNPWYLFPEDYSLFYIGTYDQEHGTFESINPKPVVSASACRSVVQETKIPEIENSKNGVNVLSEVK